MIDSMPSLLVFWVFFLNIESSLDLELVIMEQISTEVDLDLVVVRSS